MRRNELKIAGTCAALSGDCQNVSFGAVLQSSVFSMSHTSTSRVMKLPGERDICFDSSLGSTLPGLMLHSAFI